MKRVPFLALRDYKGTPTLKKGKEGLLPVLVNSYTPNP